MLKYLESRAYPAIIACPIRGKKATDQGQATATRALCQGRKSYRTTYTFSNRETTFEASLAVCRVFTTARRTGRMQRRATWLIFIVIGAPLAWPRAVRRLYRKRFGTSYRLSGQVRGWTSSKNAAYRFVLIALSFFMVNVWVHLCWLTRAGAASGRSLSRRGTLPFEALRQVHLAGFGAALRTCAGDRRTSGTVTMKFESTESHRLPDSS